MDSRPESKQHISNAMQEGIDESKFDCFGPLLSLSPIPVSVSQNLLIHLCEDHLGKISGETDDQQRTV